MAKRVIKNDYVTMEWDADLFFESKHRGLVAAIQMYPAEGKDDVPVVFMDKKAFILVDADTSQSCSVSEVIEGIKECFKAGDLMEDYFPDNYIQITDGVDQNIDALKYQGISEDCLSDIEARLTDLTNGYWQEVLEDFS